MSDTLDDLREVMERHQRETELAAAEELRVIVNEKGLVWLLEQAQVSGCVALVHRSGTIDERCGFEPVFHEGGLALCGRHWDSVEGFARKRIREQDRAEAARRADEWRREQDALEEATVVYFARREADGAIKIGRSTNVEQRMRDLDLVLLGTLGPRTGHVERRLHRRFAHLRLDGEYFSPAAELEAYVQERSV